MSEAKKPFKVTMIANLGYAPDRGELDSMLDGIKKIIIRHLIPIWGVKVIIECPKCNYETEINPSKKKANWYCRNCGAVILFDNLG